MSTIHSLERHVLQIALSRGYISQKDLERAAKFRQKLVAHGRRTRLLQVLRPFIKPKDHRELERIWKTAGQSILPVVAGSSEDARLASIEERIALGNLDGALRDLAEFVQQFPQPGADFYFVRGEVLALLDRGDEARLDLRRFLEMAPAHSRAGRAQKILRLLSESQ